MSPRQVVRWVLGAVIVLLFSMVTVVVVRSGDPRYVDLLLGALIGAFTTVVGYYFGSADGP